MNWVPLLCASLLAAAYSPAQVETPRPFREDHRVLRAFSGEGIEHRFGFHVRRIGDLNGDGKSEFAVAALSYPNGEIERAGAVFVYSPVSDEPLFVCKGSTARGRLGLGLGPLGDTDGDDIPDFVAGEPGRGDRPARAFVYSGKDGSVLHVLSSGIAGDGYGNRVFGAGDLDGDGAGDVLVCACKTNRSTGRLYAYSGRTAEVLFTLDGRAAAERFACNVAADPWTGRGRFAITVMGDEDGAGGRVEAYRMVDGRPRLEYTVERRPTSARMGVYYLSFVGDVDADGTADLYIADGADEGNGDIEGRVVVHSGATGELLLELTGQGGFGSSNAYAGDVNNDGHDDLIIGSWHYNEPARAAGRCQLFSGKDGSLLATYSGLFKGATLGHDATGIGDVDGDGVPDLLIANAGNSNTATHRVGHVYLVAGPRLPEGGK